MALGDRAHDREPEARAGVVDVRVCPGEGFEGALAEPVGEPGARILEDDPDVTVRSFGGDVHDPFLRRVPQGVVDEVVDGLTESHRIQGSRDRARVDLQPDPTRPSSTSFLPTGSRK